MIGLINFTGDEFAGAGGASTGTAGIREVNASLFSRVKDVFRILDLDGFVEALGGVLEGDLEGSHGEI